MILTFLARVLDGLILVETWEQQGSDASMNVVKQDAKKLLKNVNHGPTRMTVELKSFYQFHYLIEDGVCFLSVCEKNYPKKLAFAFLEDIHRHFLEELKREFGTSTGIDYRSHVETVEKPYYFIKFDRVIQKLKNEYKDPGSSKSIQKLNESLHEVSNIMKKNIDEMLMSEDKISAISNRGQDLLKDSDKFAKAAQLLSLQALAKKYGLVAMLIFMTVIVIYVKLF